MFFSNTYNKINNTLLDRNLMNKIDKIVILGGSGFIGAQLATKLSSMAENFNYSNDLKMYLQRSSPEK